MKTWKCSVCGYVIVSDEVPKQCPLCGVGSEFFEEVIEEATEVKSSDRHIVIIGGGIAALSAAKTLRANDEGCQIDLYTLEDVLPYERIQLSKQLMKCEDQQFLIQQASWYEEHQIKVHTGEEILRLDTEKQQIETLSGMQVAYDELILAQGAHAFIPPIRGNDLDQVMVLRSLQDAKQLAHATQKSRRCVILGGGILGLEAACSLAEAHIDVTVIETMPALMAKQLDPIGSELLKQYLEKQKIHVLLNTQVKAFHGISRVESVELEHGKCINTDFVLLSTGIRANLNLVKSTDIQYDHFIHVDAQMKTSVPHVYACGDVASCEGYHDGLWPTALMQGEIAARTILGQDARFVPQAQPILFQQELCSIFMIGDIRQMDQHIELFDETNAMYEKYAYQDGKCSGALLFNRNEQIDRAWNAFTKQASFISALHTHRVDQDI